MPEEEPPPPPPPDPESEETVPYIKQAFEDAASTPASTPPGPDWVPPTPAELDAEMPAFKVRQILGFAHHYSSVILNSTC